jgi:hypothetical protein
MNRQFVTTYAKFIIAVFSFFLMQIASGAVPRNEHVPVNQTVDQTVAPIRDPIPVDVNLPAAPEGILVENRTDNSVLLRWAELSDAVEGFELQQRTSNESWIMLTSGGQSATNSYQLDNLQPDTRYCYRIKVYNDQGQAYSSPRCVFTRDGHGYGVYRVQLRIHTADVSDAGTDDSISVLLNESFYTAPSGNKTWLDYGRDDYERGDEFTYDLSVDKLSEIGDITHIQFAKSGSNGWCIQDLALLVNGVEVYSQAFGATSSSCHWLDNDNGHSRVLTISHAALRAHSAWLNYEPPQPMLDLSEFPDFVTATVQLPREELESRIESMLGDEIHDNQAYWGHLHGRAVEVIKKSDNAVGVDLDLSVEMTGPNPEVDIDFDMLFGVECSDNLCGTVELNLDARNFQASVDFNWFFKAVGFIAPCGPILSIIKNEGIPNCSSYLEEYIEKRITGNLNTISQSIEFNTANGCCDDVTLAIDDDANISISFRVDLRNMD